MAPQLSDEEGVAVAAGGHHRRQPVEVVVKVLTRGPGNERRHVARLEACDPYSPNSVDTPKIRERGRHVFRHLVGGVAQRPEDQHPRRGPGPGDVAEKREGLGATPVQVVEHDDERPPASGVGEH